MENKRVGILGGSFDPPTIAHEKLGNIFLDNLHLDEVRYVVTRQNPLKTHDVVASKEHRWNMIQMMIEGHEKFSASDIEVQDELIYETNNVYSPSDSPTPAYAYNTLKAFQMFEPHTEFIFLGGSDILTNLNQWHKAEVLIKEFKFGIAVRLPYSVGSTLAPLSPQERKKVTVIEDTNMPDISSTDVRSFLESGEFERAEVLMRPDLFDYVMKNHLYQIPQETR